MVYKETASLDWPERAVMLTAVAVSVFLGAAAEVP